MFLTIVGFLAMALASGTPDVCHAAYLVMFAKCPEIFDANANHSTALCEAGECHTAFDEAHVACASEPDYRKYFDSTAFLCDPCYTSYMADVSAMPTTCGVGGSNPSTLPLSEEQMGKLCTNSCQDLFASVNTCVQKLDDIGLMPVAEMSSFLQMASMCEPCPRAFYSSSMAECMRKGMPTAELVKKAECKTYFCSIDANCPKNAAASALPGLNATMYNQGMTIISSDIDGCPLV